MIFIVTYLSLHFFLYAFFLRNLRHFYGEKTIFLYHAISFGVFLALSAIFLFKHQTDFQWAASALSLHGIYSLSFLEFWALSDGGYSLRILDQIDRRGGSADFSSLQNLGASKKKYRLESLKKLKLIVPGLKGWGLTPRGEAAAAFLNIFVWISKQKGSV